MSEGPVITITHAIPGRIRLRLSDHRLEWERFARSVRQHPGVMELRYRRITGSLLLQYDTDTIATAELLLRAALAFSIENDLAPVVLRAQPDEPGLDEMALISALAVCAGLVTQAFPVATATRRTAEIIAAGLTLGAVGTHAVEEVAHSGNFDPEVLSVFYLVTSLVRGRGTSAAMVTWFATFGRHLVAAQDPGVTVNTVRRGAGNDATYSLTVTPAAPRRKASSLLQSVPRMVIDFLGRDAGQDSLLERLREVSKEHESLLEGLSGRTQDMVLHVS